MSGPCLSPGGGGHALTPPRRRRLGRPLPHQQPGIRSAAPWAESHHLLRRGHPVLPTVSRGYPGPKGTFRRITTPFAAVQLPEGNLLARLACLIHAANVRSEPGSNPSCDRLPGCRETSPKTSPTTPGDKRERLDPPAGPSKDPPACRATRSCRNSTGTVDLTNHVVNEQSRPEPAAPGGLIAEASRA